MGKKLRKSILVGILLILSVTLYSVDIATSPNSMTIDKHPVSILSDYVVHDPILITSDDDFETQGWPGNGTENNPYLIDGFVINGSKSPSETCLMVEDTRVHFSVTSCYFFNGQFGIQFDNVSNSRIENNEIHPVDADGIVITSSDFITIKNNTLLGSALHGSDHALILYNCDNTTIAKNTCIEYWNFGCICLSSDCNNNTISSNFCSSRRGIWLWDSSQNTLFNNTCNDNSNYGIFITSSSSNPLYYCYGNILLNNSCDDNGYGMWIERCSFFTITNNTVCDNTYNGIQFNAGINSSLTNNQVLYNGQHGIVLGENSEFNTLYRNIIGWNSQSGLQENAEDYGSNNSWDDGISIGNIWSDYTGSTTNYSIHGSAGSVNHYPMKADTISPTIDTPNDREIQFGFNGYSITWNPYDEHPETYSVYREGVLIESDTWYGSSITVDIDDLELGVYNYTLIVSDTCWNTRTDTVIVTVLDTTEPIIDGPDDFQYEYGTTNHRITWTITEFKPYYFAIYRNEIQIDSGPWDGSNIQISVDGLDFGTYNFTLVVSDTSNNNASSTVLVTVMDTINPVINSLEDIQFTKGTTGHSLTWTLQDTNPFSFVVVMDSIEIASGPWNSTGETVTIVLDHITVGTHFITITITDLAGNEVSDVVIVSVLPESTTITTGPLADSQFQFIAVLGIGFGVVILVIVFVVFKRK